MNTKITLFGFLSFFSYITSNAQTYEETLEADRKAQKLTEMYVKSANVKLPDSVYTILKDFALKNNKSEALVLKQEFLLKMIYNTDLSIEDRILACDSIIKQYNRNKTKGPLTLVISNKIKLQSITK